MALKAVVAVIALAWSLTSVRAAEDQLPAFWSVTGVAADASLHLRDVPSADSKSLARIPPNASGLKALGCRRTTLGLQDWMHMTAADRQGVQTLWCRVEYNGQQGWVAGRFLAPQDGGR